MIPPVCFFYFLSDNDELKRSAIIKQNKIRTVSSTIFHMNRSTTGDLIQRKQGNIDTYAELAFLSNASCIVDSLSTFSGVAASIGKPLLDCFSLYSSCSAETVDHSFQTPLEAVGGAWHQPNTSVDKQVISFGLRTRCAACITL